jgi:polysaccharide export outer membrane protein
MKKLKSALGHIVATVGIVSIGLLLAGCQSGPQFEDFPVNQTGNAKQPNAPYTYQKPVTGRTDFFQKGDSVNVTFTGVNGDPVLPTYSEAIKDDGRITPPIIGSVVAAGKSPGELQSELQQKYDKYYRNLTVTVKSDARYYYVDGEVKSPGPKTYLGETDIISAISSAGGFTDFANKRKIRLTRGKKTQIINYNQAVENPQYDVPVYPGDQILVPRRLF